MPRTPIMGAGGIVVRGGPRPLIALVQRSKDDAWVLPKGKLKRGEVVATDIDCRYLARLDLANLQAPDLPRIRDTCFRDKHLDSEARRPYVIPKGQAAPHLGGEPT